MIAPEAETRVLQFLATDEFCSPFEIATVLTLWDADGAAADALVAAWVARGWVQVQSQDDPSLPPMVHLTAAGYAEVERRLHAS